MIEVRVRRLSITVSILATLLAFIGVILGALWLASHWGLAPYMEIYPVHPDLMINGFLTLFIMSVAFLLIPRFRNRRLERIGESYLAAALIFSGNLMLLAWSITEVPLILPAFILILLGSLIFSAMVVSILRWPSGVLAVADPYLLLSVVFLPLSLLVRVASGTGYGNPAYLVLSLLGFPTLMIFGVMTRTVHFRVVVLRKSLVKAAFPLILASLAISTATSLNWDPNLFTLSSALYLAGGVFFVFGVDGLKVVRSGEQYSRMRERDRVRYDYFSICFAGAVTWLLAGLVLGLLYSLTLYSGSPVFSLRDGFIHSVTVGFMATTIMAYGPIMLPPLLSSHTPYKGLTLIPVMLVWAGNLWRVAGFLFRDFLGLSLELNGLSGILIVVGLLYFLFMTHRLRD